VTFGALDVLLVVALLALPLRGWSQWRPVRRTSWYAGCAVVAATVLGHLGGDPRSHFFATTLQFCLLFFVAPLLLALGLPMPRATSRWVVLVGPGLACVVTLVWFLTPWLHLELSHELLWQVGHLVALGTGWLFCASAVQAGDQDPSAYPVLLMVAFLELLLDAVPGILVTLRKTVLAPSVFLAHHTATAVTAAHHSQVHGGELLWAIAELLDLPFVAALVFHWMRSDARQAAGLDAHSAATPSGEADLQRPWWETDGSVFGDRARQYRRED
jgi:putative membrane protein